jgi:hypothetical protein
VPLHPINWIRRRPLAASVYAFIVFAVVSFPTWLSDVWALFSDRPLAGVIARYPMGPLHHRSDLRVARGRLGWCDFDRSRDCRNQAA